MSNDNCSVFRRAGEGVRWMDCQISTKVRKYLAIHRLVDWSGNESATVLIVAKHSMVPASQM